MKKKIIAIVGAGEVLGLSALAELLSMHVDRHLEIVHLDGSNDDMEKLKAMNKGVDIKIQNHKFDIPEIISETRSSIKSLKHQNDVYNKQQQKFRRNQKRR